MPASLKDKVVVITGASSGIGAATAREFARQGAKVVLAARREDRLHRLQAEITASGGHCMALPTDVTQEAAVEQLFAGAEEAFGPVDILVNNAGRGLKAPLLSMTYAEWESVIHTNLTSVFLCTRAAASGMARHGTRGHIITVSSIAGLYVLPTYSAYGASKHGVTGFMRAAKGELGQLGIKTSTLYPARVNTPFFEAYAERPSTRQMLSPSDLARYITAIATRSRPLVAYIRLVLVWKRIYNLFRPS